MKKNLSLFLNILKAIGFKACSGAVYGSSIRTNNDLEGWHNRINNKIPEKANLYVLIDGLKFEGDLVCLHTKLLSEGQTIQFQRQNTLDVHHQIFKIWNKLEKRQITASQLLEEISLIY